MTWGTEGDLTSPLYAAPLQPRVRHAATRPLPSGATGYCRMYAFDECRRAKSLLDLTGAPDWVKGDFALLDPLARAGAVP